MVDRKFSGFRPFRFRDMRGSWYGNGELNGKNVGTEYFQHFMVVHGGRVAQIRSAFLACLQ